MGKDKMSTLGEKNMVDRPEGCPWVMYYMAISCSGHLRN
jgi:hypothetical protein